VSATKLTWETDARAGYTREVARLGGFELTITSGGAATIGVTVFVGTFEGRVCVIAGSFAECERHLLHAAKHELLRAGAELGQVS
jgi:hypothetical protein